MTNVSKKRKSSKRKPSKRKVKKLRRRSTSKGRSLSFQSAIRKIKNNILKQKPSNINDAVKIAMRSVNHGKIRQPRIIRIPKTGGILPLIPIFAGLSALGALSGGAAGIAKAVNDARAAKQQLQESQRHNKTMESIALGKGLFLRPYRTGLGLFFRKTTQDKEKKATIRLPNHALSNFDIEKYIKQLKIKHFRGVFMKDRLPKKVHKYESGVINLDNSFGPGTHWTAYKKCGNTIYYFDSFGNLKPRFEVCKYFNSGGKCNIFYNHNRYQSYNSFRCGHLCIKFLYDPIEL